MPTIKEILDARKRAQLNLAPHETIQHAARAKITSLTLHRAEGHKHPPAVETITIEEAAAAILERAREDRATPEDAAAVAEWLAENVAGTVDHMSRQQSIPLAAISAIEGEAAA